MDGYLTKPVNPRELAATILAAFPAALKLPADPADALPEGPSDAALLARFDGDSE